MHATPNAPLFLKQSSRVCMRGNQSRDVLWLKMARAGQAGFVFSDRGKLWSQGAMIMSGFRCCNMRKPSARGGWEDSARAAAAHILLKCMKLRAFPDMHEAFNAFCVAFKTCCII